jgi:hypothetical protein
MYSLPSDKKEEELLDAVADYFEKYGRLAHVKVLKDWLARPYAFVQYEVRCPTQPNPNPPPTYSAKNI